MNDIIKPHYRAIILILASNNNNIYKNCRKIWKAYMNVDPTIKVCFVYGKLPTNDILEDFDEKSDFIFSDIKEEDFPFIIEKTIRAMQLIDAKLSYDFFIRTNLSTFWDFKKLHLHLNDLPTKNCYSGDGPFDENTEKIYKDADILMHECYMYDTRIRGHVAAVDVFEMAKRCNVKCLALSHFKRAFNDETRAKVKEAIPSTGLKIILPQPLEEYQL